MLRVWSTLAVVTASLLAFSALAASPEAAPAPVTGIRVWFKSDPLLSGPTYGGERWFSSSKFTSAVQGGTIGTVDVKVRGVDAKGKLLDIVPVWVPADPQMLSVAPREKGEFRITVKRPGTTKLRVVSQSGSKELEVSAKSVNQGLQVEVTQASEPKSLGVPSPSGADNAAKYVDSASKLTSDLQKSSYALGIQMGSALKGKRMTVDADLVGQGVADALAERPSRLSDEDARTALAALRSEVQAKQKESAKRLAEKNEQDALIFLAQNRLREGVVTLDSGLQYRVLTAGQGGKPKLEDTVVCHYVGTLINGKEFDSTRKHKGPATLPVRAVVKGMREALQLMPVGSKWQLFIPPELAYGANGVARSSIGPNAALVFEVELLSINEPARIAQKPAPTRADPAMQKTAGNQGGS